jgi:hypothetical protein
MTDTVMTEAGPKAVQGGTNGLNGGDNAISATTSTVSQDGGPEKTREKDTGERQKNSEEGSEEKIETYTPDDRRKEIHRILRWPEWAYYEILEVPEDAGNAAIKKAFHDKSKKTHTDRNGDVDAKKVFQSKYNVFKDMTEAKAEHRSLRSL